MAAPGSYLLVTECETSTEIEVGALGSLTFEHGYYGYVGSAFGPGGLSRVDRHRRTAAGDHEVRHWHVDYLLAAAASRLATVETYPDQDLECGLAAGVAAGGCESIEAFGASDCDCVSHLWGPTTQSKLLTLAERVDAQSF